MVKKKKKKSELNSHANMWNYLIDLLCTRNKNLIQVSNFNGIHLKGRAS